MKNTMKLFLAMVIFCSVNFAGEQPNGGYQCGNNCPPPCTENCRTANPTGIGSSDLILAIVKEYLRMRF